MKNLLSAHRGPGEARRTAAAYCAALLAGNRWEEAVEMAGRALDENGSEPSRAELLLLRAQGAQRLGNPGHAIRDLLGAAETDVTCLELVSPHIQALIPAAAAHDARRFLLEEWAPMLRSRVPEQAAVVVAELELQAAVLEHREDVALQALQTLRERAGQDGLDAARRVLLDIHVRAPADAQLFSTLAVLEKQVELRAEARADVDRAVEIGLSADDASGQSAAAMETRLYELKADLFDPETESEQAAAAYASAGEHAYRMGDFAAAVRLLERAVQGRVDIETHFYLGDAGRLLARESPDPDQKAQLLERALDAFERVDFAADLDTANVWGLQAFALIHVELAEIRPLQAWPHTAQAAAAFERRLLVDGGDVTTWGQLASCLRDLAQGAAGRLAAERALEIDPEDPFGLLILMLEQLRTGDPGMKSTASRLLDDSRMVGALRGMMLYVQGEYSDAEAAFRDALDDPSNGLLARYMLGDTLLCVGRPDDAREQYAELWRLMEADEQAAAQLGFPESAQSAYQAGQFRDALEILGQLIAAEETATFSVTDVYGLLFLCQLEAGDMTAARAAMKRVRTSSVNHYDVTSLRRDVLAQAARSRRQGHPAQAVLAEEFAAALESIAERIRDADTSLDAAIASIRAAVDGTGVRRLPRELAALTSARLLLSGERWDDAAQELASLLEMGIGGRAERDVLTAKLLSAVDTLLSAGQIEKLPQILEQALAALASSPENSAARTSLSARLIVVYLLQQDDDAVRRTLGAETLDVDSVASVMRVVVADNRRLKVLRQGVRALEEPALHAAFGQFLDEFFRLNSEPEDGLWPVTTPIVLEIATDLVPADTSSDGPLFATHIPALRRRIEDDTGVQIPGIRVRHDESLPAGHFRTQICDGFPQTGMVRPGVFVAVPMAVARVRLGSEAVLEPATHPVTQAEACWVAPEQDAQPDGQPEPTGTRPEDDHGVPSWVRSAGERIAGIYARATGRRGERSWRKLIDDTGTWTDPLAYPLFALERELRNHLPEFLVPDRVGELVSSWLEADGAQDSASEPGIDTRPDIDVVRLTTLLRDLLAEGVWPKRPAALDQLARATTADIDYEVALAACRRVLVAGRAASTGSADQGADGTASRLLDDDQSLPDSPAITSKAPATGG